MAKKKGKSDKKQDASATNASISAQAELVHVTPSTEVAASTSCMEVATTPCTNIAEALNHEVVDADDSPELWADLANAPCTDIAVEPSTDITVEASTDEASNLLPICKAIAASLILSLNNCARCSRKVVLPRPAHRPGSFTGTHTMNLNVKAGSVDMNLSTVTEANQELLELKTQIDLLQRLLEESGVRLDVANQRIGALEAEMALKNKMLDEKLEQGSWLEISFRTLDGNSVGENKVDYENDQERLKELEEIYGEMHLQFSPSRSSKIC